jgi:hypothetical protein
MVKANQPLLRDDLALFFALPAIVADQEHWEQVETVNAGHGRYETRRLEVISADCSYLNWPGASQVCRRTCTRYVYKTGTMTSTVTVVHRTREWR